MIAKAITLPDGRHTVHNSSTFGVALVALNGILERPATAGNGGATQVVPDTSGIRAFTEEEKEMLSYIEQKESEGNHLAQSPSSTAFGRFQFLNSTWATVGCVKTSDPVEQERCAILYMEQRYGGIEGAYYHHLAHNWY